MARGDAEALQSYDRAIALQPDYPEAFNNRRITTQELRRYEEALASYRRALALKPDYAIAASARFGITMQLCDWKERSIELADLIRRCQSGQTTLPFVMLSVIDSSELHQRAAQLWVRE